MRDYLARMGIYDGKHLKRLDDSIAVSSQRERIKISKNPIKQRMLRDLLRGGTLPALVLYEKNGRWTVIDGYQRTDVITEGLRTILAVENEDEIEPYAEEQLAALKKLDQQILSSDEFLERPLTLQVWQDLEHDELVRLFIVLNAGQQKVAPRHLLEIMQHQLKEMFEGWGLPVITLKEEKERPRTRRSKDSEPTGSTAFKFEMLVDGLVAYATRNPQVKTWKLLESEFPDNLAHRVTDIGSEYCKADFIWVCQTLNSFIRERYKGKPKWEGFVHSDNYFIPLMAALGWARQHSKPAVSAHVEERQSKLMELLEQSENPDPLVFEDQNRGLDVVSETVKSNIGRKRRAIVHGAWRNFLLQGIDDPDYPLDWEFASASD
jgi:hypothetical protein